MLKILVTYHRNVVVVAANSRSANASRPGQSTSGQRDLNETFVDATENCKYFRLPTEIPKVDYLGCAGQEFKAVTLPAARL